MILTSGRPPPEITWCKGDEPVSASRRDPRVSVSWDAKHQLCVLYIKDARVSDAGNYVLRAANDKATISASVNVEVTAPTKDEFTNGLTGPDDEDQRTLSSSQKQLDSGVVNAVPDEESDLESDASFRTDVTSDMTIDISADETDDVLPTFDDLPVRSSTKGSGGVITREDVISEENLDELEVAVPIGAEQSPQSLASGSGDGSRKQVTPAVPPTKSRTPRFDFGPSDARVSAGEGVRLACKVTGE